MDSGLTRHSLKGLTSDPSLAQRSASGHPPGADKPRLWVTILPNEERGTAVDPVIPRSYVTRRIVPYDDGRRIYGVETTTTQRLGCAARLESGHVARARS